MRTKVRVRALGMTSVVLATGLDVRSQSEGARVVATQENRSGQDDAARFMVWRWQMQKTFFLVVLTALSLGCNNENAKQEAERLASIARAREAKAALENQRTMAAGATKVALAKLGSKAKLEDVVTACDVSAAVDALRLNPDIARACAAAFLANARIAVRHKNLPSAELQFKKIRSTGVKSAEIDREENAYLSLANAAEKKEAKKRALEQTIATASERAQYARTLRTHYLDEGLDIKVSFSGKYNEAIKLEFVLFNDVWLHNFQKGSLKVEMQLAGFKKVHLTDGYDWGYEITLAE